jgi:hypothetical protein
MSGIVLSPKHGVNPSMSQCFWCGECEEIILFGRLKEDAEAPRIVCMGYEPCTKCAEQFKQGVQVIEVTTIAEPKDQVPIALDDKGNNTYPTGRMVVITFKAAERMFKLKNTPIIQMSIPDFENIFGRAV